MLIFLSNMVYLTRLGFVEYFTHGSSNSSKSQLLHEQKERWVHFDQKACCPLKCYAAAVAAGYGDLTNQH